MLAIGASCYVCRSLRYREPKRVCEASACTLVVLTDAQDNTPYVNSDDGVSYTLLGDSGTTALPISPDVKIYGVGIGDSIDAARLGQLAQATGGHYLHIRNFSGLDYFQLEKHFTQIYMDTVDLSTIVDPTYVINPGETQTWPAAWWLRALPRDRAARACTCSAANRVDAGHAAKPGVGRTRFIASAREPPCAVGRCTVRPPFTDVRHRR